MKLNYFYGSITIYRTDGYTENLEFNATEQSGKLEFRYPYGNINPEQAEAISQFVKTVTNAYNKLSSQIDNVNKDLKLEQYAPVTKSEETAPEISPESTVPQSCALGDEELSTGDESLIGEGFQELDSDTGQ